MKYSDISKTINIVNKAITVGPIDDMDLVNKKYVDDSIPTKVSQLENDKGYLTSLPGGIYVTNSVLNDRLNNLSIKKISQDEYNALDIKNKNVLYLITE